MIGASFDSTRTPLQDLLASADAGSLQLPDFQRGWVCDDERIQRPKEWDAEEPLEEVAS